MNPLSFILAVAAIIVFALRWKGHVGGHLGLGLALMSAAWVIQTIWITTTLITIS